ncbi:MAG TPA: EamA family transporter [Pirellulales bacterium]|jgi:drug/metabolite transporter (DMT)-like permease|nr:EamA family transporter [Pirellulales bacterium]
MTAAELPVRPAAGRLLILAAAVLWSSNGLFVKSPLFDDWPAETRGLLLAFWRALFASLALVPAVRRPQFRWGLVPMALAFTAMSFAFLQSMTLGTAANAIWLQSTAPLWVFVFTLCIYREPLHGRDLWPLAAGLAGTGLILYFELGHSGVSGNSAMGAMLGLASGIFYAFVVVSMRRLRELGAAWLVAVNHLVSAVILASFCLALGVQPHGWQWPALVLFGLGQMAIPYLLFARGLRHVSSQEGAAIALLEPVLSPLWVLLAWGERPAPWTIAGGLLILAGLALRYLLLAARNGSRPKPLAPPSSP